MLYFIIIFFGHIRSSVGEFNPKNQNLKTGDDNGEFFCLMKNGEKKGKSDV